MNKEELLNKLDYFQHGFEEKGVQEFYPFYIKIIDESDLQNSQKAYCKKILQKLLDDSMTHAKMLGELRQELSGSADGYF